MRLIDLAIDLSKSLAVSDLFEAPVSDKSEILTISKRIYCHSSTLVFPQILDDPTSHVLLCF